MNMLARAADITRSPGDPKVLSTGPSSLAAPDQMARGLGWFSIGLGMMELFAARSLARSLGMQGAEGLIRGYGVREIASGMACLSVNPVPGVASRIAGDAVDIATLLAALPNNPKRENVQLALLAVIGVTVLDVLCTSQLTARHGRPSGPGRNYSDRSGFPHGVAAAQGVAREAPAAP
jgi:hypothetical protein